MERLADCAWKNDDSRDVGHVQNPCCEGSQYPSTAAEQSATSPREGNQESGPSTRDSADPLKESKSAHEGLGLIDDAAETDWEDGNSCDFEGVSGASASPPPKRKRLSQVVLHGFRAPGVVDYALVDRDHAAPPSCCYQDTVGVSVEVRVAHLSLAVTRFSVATIELIAYARRKARATELGATTAMQLLRHQVVGGRGKLLLLLMCTTVRQTGSARKGATPH